MTNRTVTLDKETFINFLEQTEQFMNQQKELMDFNNKSLARSETLFERLMDCARESQEIAIKSQEIARKEHELGELVVHAYWKKCHELDELKKKYSIPDVEVHHCSSDLDEEVEYHHVNPKKKDEVPRFEEIENVNK